MRAGRHQRVRGARIPLPPRRRPRYADSAHSRRTGPGCSIAEPGADIRRDRRALQRGAGGSDQPSPPRRTFGQLQPRDVPADAGLSPTGRGEPVPGVGMALLPPRGGHRSAGRHARGDQGQHRGRRHTDAQWNVAARGLRPGRGRDRGATTAGRRRRDHRQDHGPLAVLRRCRNHLPGTAPQPVRLHARSGRLVGRQCDRGYHRRSRPRPRRRSGRISATTGRVERVLRPQTDLRAGALHRRVSHRAHAGPPGPHGLDGGRMRTDAGRAGRRGRSGPAPDQRGHPVLCRYTRPRTRRDQDGCPARGLRLAGHVRIRCGPAPWSKRYPFPYTATASRCGT